MINYYRRRPLYRMLASLWNNSPQALRVGGSSLTCVLPSSASRLLPAAPSVAQARAMGSKKRFSEITIEPYKTPRRKQARNQQLRDGKFPLKSEERIQRDLLMPMNPRSLGGVISTYVPLEKFARPPFFSKHRIAQKWKAFKETVMIIYSGAIIRGKLKKIEPFKPMEFARAAQQQFTDVNKAIRHSDKLTLRELTTEDASLSLKREFETKRFKWKLLEDVERPRIVNARVAPLISKDNLYGQVVVRMHTKQIQAVYDSAGSLIRGHPTKPKDVIDYVVLERSLSKEHPGWRIAAKLPPQLPWRLKEMAAKKQQQGESGDNKQTSPAPSEQNKTVPA